MDASKVDSNGVIKKKRVAEIDYIKALCILAMILVHCYEELYEGDGSGASTLFVDIFNVIIGASAFMFCMGFTTDLAKEQSSKFCFLRGGILIFAGFLLNLFRGPLIMCTHFLTEEPVIVFRGMIDVLSVDILPFAGLAFLLLGILKKLKLKPWGIFIVAVIISGIGVLFRYTDTGSPVINALLGFFIGTYAESYFPLCHWFIFVAAGNLFRSYYTRYEDKKKFYAVVLPIAAVLSAVFVVLSYNEIGPFQCLGSEEYYYAWMNPIDGIGCTFCIITFMGLMWLLSLVVEKMQLKFHPFVYLSKNLTQLYFVHWILIMILEYVFIDGFELIPWPETDIAIFLYAIGFLALTILLNELIVKPNKEKFLNHFKKYWKVWAIVTIVLVVLCVVLSSANGLTEIPCFLNDYEVDGMYI